MPKRAERILVFAQMGALALLASCSGPGGYLSGGRSPSPDGTQVLVFRICFDTGSPLGGIYLTDTAGSYRTFVSQGFGADWNPAWKP